MNYWIIVNGQQKGPFTIEQLRWQKITPQTDVWGDGMPNWTKASQVPELQSLFTAGAAQPSQQAAAPQQQQTQQQYQQPVQQQYQPDANQYAAQYAAPADPYAAQQMQQAPADPYVGAGTDPYGAQAAQPAAADPLAFLNGDDNEGGNQNG